MTQQSHLMGVFTTSDLLVHDGSEHACMTEWYEIWLNAININTSQQIYAL